MRLSNRVTGLFLVALGGVAAYAGSRLPPVPGQQIGPNVFPLVIGLGLAACGAMIAVGVGQRFEDEAEAELAAHTDHSADEARPRGFLWNLRVLIPPGLLLGYVFFVDLIGFIPTAAALVLIASLALGAAWRLAVPLAAVAPVMVHLIFYKLLRVPLPDGYLPMPWS